MKRRDEIVTYYIIFPYLHTNSRIDIGKISLFPSNNLEILDEHEVNIFNNLSKIFYASSNYMIEDFVYTKIEERYDLTDFGYDEDTHLEYKKILQVRELIIYLYSSLHPTMLDPFLSLENCNCYALREEDMVIDAHKNNKRLVKINPSNQESSYHNGYYGVINERSFFSLLPDEKLFPPTNSIVFNHYQSLSNDIVSIPNDSVFSFLVNQKKINLVISTPRLFRSMNWFNKANSSDNSAEEELIKLSIAFESLLDFEKDKDITKRFKYSLLTLLGENEKLESWITQFYDARSEIVHRGRVTNILYKNNPTKDSLNRYRQLVSYGRRIFQIVFSSIIQSEYLKHTTELIELFTSNRERLLELRKMYEQDSNETIQQILDNIEKFRFIGEENLTVKDIISFLKLSIKRYYSEENQNGNGVINTFLKERDILKSLVLYEKVNSIISSEDVESQLEQINNICWRYLFRHVYHAKETETI